MDGTLTSGKQTGRLDRLLGFQLRMASAAIARDFAAAVGKFDLTQKQYAVLELVAEHDGISQIDIAAILSTDRATMMALVDRLIERGLIDKQPSPVDRRRLRLVLTKDARSLLPKLRQAIATHEERFVAMLGLSTGEREKLFAALRRLY